MRGDKSPPTISTKRYNKLLLIGTERHMGRSLQYSAIHECRDSACRHLCKTYSLTASAPTNRARSRTLQKIKTSPNTKTSPMTPPFSKSETNFRFVNGGVMGEVLGERGRFGGREPRLSRGGSLPPRSSFPCLSYPFAAAISSCFLASRSALAFSMSDL